VETRGRRVETRGRRVETRGRRVETRGRRRRRRRTPPGWTGGVMYRYVNDSSRILRGGRSLDEGVSGDQLCL